MNNDVDNIIKEALHEWIAALDSVEDAIFIHDKEFRILRCNKAYQQYAKLPFNEIIGKLYFEIFPKSYGPLHSCSDAINKSFEVAEEELEVGDTIFRSRGSSITDKKGEYLYSIHTLEDITQNKKLYTELETSESRYKRLFESAKDGILIIEAKTELILDANPFIMNILKYEIDELVGKKLWEIGLFADKQDSIIAFKELKKERYIRYENMPLQDKDGKKINVEFISNVYKVGNDDIIQCNIRDISERLLSERMLKESELKFKMIFEGASDGILIADAVTRKFADSNERIRKMLGDYTKEEVLSLGIEDIHPAKDIPYVLTQFEKQAKGEIELAADIPVKRKDGTLFFADINSFLLTIENKKYLVGFFRDITKRKENEAALKRSNRALRTLSATNMLLIHTKSEKKLLQEVTDIIVKAENGGYSFAVVCYKEDYKEKGIIPMAWSGGDKSYFWEEHTNWDEAKQSQLPICIAIDTSTAQICRDIKKECNQKPWRDAALSLGYASNIALPLSNENETFGAISIYSTEVKFFDEEEVKLLEELASDLSYGIINLRRRIEHKKQTLLFKESLEQSIQAIAATIESRDPYTAGHQRRVGELATAIAQEMGLPENQIQGIHFAAIIHDLGKIHIPSEILSKPGKLNDLEYRLIQIHPQSGYEILKNIKFPWPIADIVLQHHERLDGSGYPQGLNGNEILIESKIMSVADVVEAISSHRPYRPSLGIEYALNEITRGRGVLYDELAVDACLKLFREKEFKFSV